MKQLIKSLFVLTVISMFFVTMMQLPAPVQATTTLDSKKTDLESAWFTAIPVYDSLWKPYLNTDTFSNDFEELMINDAEWTDSTTTTGDSVLQSNVDPYNGSYHAICAVDGSSTNEAAYLYKTFSSSHTDLYAQADFKIKDSLPTSGTTEWIMGFYSGATYIAAVTVINDTGNYKWRISYNDDTGSQTTQNLTVFAALDTWYTVQLYTKVDSTEGTLGLWVNGVELISKTGLNNTVYGGITAFRCGHIGGSEQVAHDLYVDNAAVSTTFMPLFPMSNAWSAEDNMNWGVGNNNFTTQSGTGNWVWAHGGGVAYLYAYAYKSSGYDGYSGNTTLRDMVITWLDGYFFNKRLGAETNGYYTSFLPYQSIGFSLKAADLIWDELNSTVQAKIQVVAQELGDNCQPNLDKGSLENVNQRMWTVGGLVYAIEVSDNRNLITEIARSNMVTMINNATVNVIYENSTMEGGLGYTENGNVQGFYHLVCTSNLAVASEYGYNSSGVNALLLESANYTKAIDQVMGQFGWGGAPWQSRKFFDNPSTPIMGAITAIELAKITGDGEFTYVAEKTIDTVINLINSRGFQNAMRCGYNITSFVDPWVNPYIGHLLDVLSVDLPNSVTVPTNRVYGINGATSQIDFAIVITDKYVGVVGYCADKTYGSTNPVRRWAPFIDNPTFALGELGSVVWLSGNTYLNNTLSFGWQYRSAGMSSLSVSNAAMGNPQFVSTESLVIGSDFIYDRKTLVSYNNQSAPPLILDTLMTYNFTAQRMAINGSGALFPWISTSIGSPSGTAFSMYGNESSTPQTYQVTNLATGTANTTNAFYHSVILSNSEFSLFMRRQEATRPSSAFGQRFVETPYNVPASASGASPDGYDAKTPTDHIELFAGGDIYTPVYVESPSFDLLFVPEQMTGFDLAWDINTQTSSGTINIGDTTYDITSQFTGAFNINQTIDSLWENWYLTTEGLLLTSNVVSTVIYRINGIPVNEIYSVKGVPLNKIGKVKGTS